MHGAAEWGSLVGAWGLDSQEGLWDQRPLVGALPREVAKALVRVLGGDAASDEPCSFAIWTGYPNVQAEWPIAPVVTLAGREYLLLAGPMSAVGEPLTRLPGYESPNLWWPGTHAWCVATDIDLMTTYIGGSDDLVARLVAADDIEAIEVSASQRLAWDSDQINPLPRPPYLSQ